MMRMILLGAMCMLSACGTRSLEISARPIQIETQQAADPAAVQMMPVNLRVVNPDNLDAFVAQLRTEQGVNEVVFVAISMRDYENLALNVADLRRYIEQQRAVITYYRRITAPVNSN